jgi:hypothetical protein
LFAVNWCWLLLQPTDVVHLAVKHIGVLRSTVVGVALMSVADFVAQDGKIMRIQLVHPDDLNKHTGSQQNKTQTHVQSATQTPLLS